MKEDKTCKNYLYATYATCSSCNLDGKYTSCYGYNEKCKFRPVYKKSEQKMNRSKIVIQSDTLYLGPRKKEGGNGTPKFEKVSYDNSEPENQMPPSD